VDELIEERSNELSGKHDLLMVTNSPMILRDDNKSFIGFGTNPKKDCRQDCNPKDYISEDYFSVVRELSGCNGILKIRDDNDTIAQRITGGIARGWSIKHRNKVSEIIPCIGAGSCLKINGSGPEILAAMEVYGIGEMINSGYGDVYFTEGRL
jgi:hypothetical protein